MKLDKKNIILISGYIVLLIISYQVAIKKTIETYRQHKELDKDYNKHKTLPKKINSILQEKENLELQRNKLKISQNLSRNGLIEYLSRETEINDIKIISFNEPHTSIENNQTIFSFTFELKGSFLAMLKLLNKLENSGAYGTISHLQFETKRNFDQNKNELTVKTIVQQIR
ncbi:hypothetical protein [Croceivirga radicis]|uniref:hypothetical protein n=1 Tax=Croceivirga radicis TaxID=1929488 RepID=UPI000255B3E0|nr:hypothetical protein [Croceivirga radicis]